MEVKVICTGFTDIEVNTYIVPLAGNDVFVVDPADSLLGKNRYTVINYLKENNLSPVAVILTHGHFDHVSGIPDFKATYPDVPVLIHSGDKDFIGEDSARLQKINLQLTRSLELLPSVTNLPPADGFLEDGKTLADLDLLSKSAPETLKELSKWKIINTPGHSPGSICLHNAEDKILISGDTMFFRSYGRTDLPNGSYAKLRSSLRLLEKTIPFETLVYPGHEKCGFTMGSNINFLDY